MKLLLTIIILLAFLTQPTSTLAFSRDEWLQNARIRSSIITTVNIVSTQVQVQGSAVIGNNASNSNSFQTIQEAVNRLNQLRTSLRLR